MPGSMRLNGYYDENLFNTTYREGHRMTALAGDPDMLYYYLTCDCLVTLRLVRALDYSPCHIQMRY